MGNDLFRDSMLVAIHHEMRERNKQMRRDRGEVLWEDLSKEEQRALADKKNVIVTFVLTTLFGSLGLLYVSVPYAILLFFANFFLHFFASVLTGVYGFLIVRMLTVLLGVFMVLHRNRSIDHCREKHLERLRRMGWA